MRGILAELQADLDTPDKATVVVDMEAGLEHLKRGTPKHTDVLLVVAEPFFRSAETAVRTAAMGRELGIPRVGVVANKVKDEADADIVRKIFARSDIPLLAFVPFDEFVGRADRQATSVVDVNPDAPIVQALGGLLDDLLVGEPAA